MSSTLSDGSTAKEGSTTNVTSTSCGNLTCGRLRCNQVKEDHEKPSMFQRELHFQCLRTESTPWHRELSYIIQAMEGEGGEGVYMYVNQVRGKDLISYNKVQPQLLQTLL